MKASHSWVLGVVTMVGAVAGCDGENTGGYYGTAGAGIGDGTVGGAHATTYTPNGTLPASGGTAGRTTPNGTGSTPSGTTGTISCTLSTDGKVTLCLTAPGTEQDCLGSDSQAGETAKVVAQCPSGAVLTCAVDANSHAYIYDQDLVAALKQISPTDPCSALLSE